LKKPLAPLRHRRTADQLIEFLGFKIINLVRFGPINVEYVRDEALRELGYLDTDAPRIVSHGEPSHQSS
jgi:hypothetical protein